MPRLSLLCLLLALIVAPYATSQEARYLTVDEDKLHYTVTGDGAPLVMVSGGSGMDIWQWHLIAPRLAQSYQVILVDPRGVGGSDNPTATYSNFDDLALLLDHLGHKRAAFLGLSSSGGMVLEFAARHPSRVTQVVALAPFINGYQFGPAMQARMKGIMAAAEKGNDVVIDHMLGDNWFLPAPLNRSIRDEARAVMLRNGEKRANFDPAFRMRTGPQLIDRLVDIKAPVLILTGVLDHPEVHARDALILSKVPTAQKQLIKNAGHNAPLENPSPVIEAALAFLTPR